MLSVSSRVEGVVVAVGVAVTVGVGVRVEVDVGVSVGVEVEGGGVDVSGTTEGTAGRLATGAGAGAQLANTISISAQTIGAHLLRAGWAGSTAPARRREVSNDWVRFTSRSLSQDAL